jgi:hypothetical protein
MADATTPTPTAPQAQQQAAPLLLPAGMAVPPDMLPVQYYQPQRMEKPEKEPLSKRSLYSIIAGAVSGAAAWFAAHVYSQDKMLEFDVAYQKKAQDIITGKGGLGAAIADAGVAQPGLLGLGNNIANGTSAHLIESLAHDQLILENPGGKYNFAKWMRRIGGKGTFNMGVGVGVGAAVGLTAYAMMKPDPAASHASAHEKPQDWQSKLDAEPDQTRTLG